jgi:epoxyqueuosine reductase
MNNKFKIQELALQAGFDLFGVSKAGEAPDFSHYEEWIKRGFEGEMEYLKTRKQERSHTDHLLRGAKSIICLGLNYNSNNLDPEIGISRYAQGEDYHLILKKMMKELWKSVEEEMDRKIRARFFVDTAPILERSFARKAGLGWIGKNTCLINEKIGSWFFLGEIVTELDLDEDQPLLPQCGDCQRCLDACPTGALSKDGFINASRCLSYLTIENQGPIPIEFRKNLGKRIFGCDTCQEACPYNQNRQPSNNKELLIKNQLPNLSLKEFLQMDKETFSKVFKNSPIKRATFQGFQRNCMVAAGNSKDTALIPHLVKLKEKITDSMLSEHLDWAIKQLKETQ